MSLFNFGRQLDANKDYSLEDIPIFSTLSSSERRLIEKKVRRVEYKRGDLVYKENESANFFYVVISGRLRVFTPGKANQDTETLLFLYRGDHFGETSLLTQKEHSASVEAKSDAVVLQLPAEDFHKLIREIPAISLHLNRSLGHRLTKSLGHGGARREVKIAALYSQSDPTDSFPFWIDFSSRIVRETGRKVIVVDFVHKIHPNFSGQMKKTAPDSFDLANSEISDQSSLRESLIEHPNGFFYVHVVTEGIGGEGDKKIASLLTFLTYRFDYIMVRLDKNLEDVTFRALNQSDMIYVYGSPETDDLISCSATLMDFQQSYGFSRNEIKVIMPQTKGKPGISFEDKEDILKFRIFSVLPSKEADSERYHATVRYFAREFSEKLIGLALGSGAAYGLSHIGIIRVLEEENIPIDIVSGSSIGALVGAFWAAGFDADGLEKVARSINKHNGFFKLIGFSDLSLAHRGFFKGNQVIKFLESYLGDRKIQDLKFPVKIIATNLFNSEEVVLESGRVVDAIRASISIPGIVRPFHYRGQSLIDGGVIDPLPSRVLALMGVKKIIGVNVLSSPKDRIEANLLRKKKRYQKLRTLAVQNPMAKSFSSMAYKFNDRHADNIFNVIMNTVQFMEYELAQASAQECDVMLHPILREGHWAEFYNPDPYIAAGEKTARENLVYIKQLLNE